MKIYPTSPATNSNQKKLLNKILIPNVDESAVKLYSDTLLEIL